MKTRFILLYILLCTAHYAVSSLEDLWTAIEQNNEENITQALNTLEMNTFQLLQERKQNLDIFCYAIFFDHVEALRTLLNHDKIDKRQLTIQYYCIYAIRENKLNCRTELLDRPLLDQTKTHIATYLIINNLNDQLRELLEAEKLINTSELLKIAIDHTNNIALQHLLDDYLETCQNETDKFNAYTRITYDGQEMSIATYFWLYKVPYKFCGAGLTAEQRAIKITLEEVYNIPNPPDCRCHTGCELFCIFTCCAETHKGPIAGCCCTIC